MGSPKQTFNIRRHVIPYIYLNGQIIHADEARISAFDRGFLYGDGLFETMRSCGGRIHLMRRHLARLRRGAEFLGMSIPSDDVLAEALRGVIEANGGSDMALRLTISRGVGGSVIEPPSDLELTIFIASRSAPALM